MFLIPNILINIILIVGIIVFLAGIIINYIPGIQLVKPYLVPIVALSALVSVGAAYLKGNQNAKLDYENKISGLRLQLAEAEVKSQQVNTEIVTKYLTKKILVKEKANATIQYIDREITKYNKECSIPNQFIIAHDAAAQSKQIEK